MSQPLFLTGQNKHMQLEWRLNRSTDTELVNAWSTRHQDSVSVAAKETPTSDTNSVGIEIVMYSGRKNRLLFDMILAMDQYVCNLRWNIWPTGRGLQLPCVHLYICIRPIVNRLTWKKSEGQQPIIPGWYISGKRYALSLIKSPYSPCMPIVLLELE